LLEAPINNKDRKNIMDILGNAASEYRHQIYFSGFWGKKRTHSMSGLKTFTKVCLDFIEHTIETNERKDKLFHAYNLISIKNDEVVIDHLSEMLEGQVAVLSSGFVKGLKAVQILDALRSSALYRPDQNSYILYPNKDLPKFLEKNTISRDKMMSFELVNLVELNQKQTIVNQDINGNFHFNGNFNNARDLKNALDLLKVGTAYSAVVEKEEKAILDLFEETFNHKAFTGRSGTFYAFEGLGSIYWHMVSKLHLAVYEICEKAFKDNEDKTIIDALMNHFREIGNGIGIHKSPEVYGAFPTDPYSHTPLHRGAQQPGMTGQVKEDILTRTGELGIKIKDGKLEFNPEILQRNEFLTESQDVTFISIDGLEKIISLEANSLAFSICQVPVIYKIGTSTHIKIHFTNESFEHAESFTLSEGNSEKVFQRTGEISSIELTLQESILR
jgi:hypothetical protein